MPRHLRDVLEAVRNNCGDDIEFALGTLCAGNARSYMSKLKARGLAYTHRSNGTTEVWITDKGLKLLNEGKEK